MTKHSKTHACSLAALLLLAIATTTDAQKPRPAAATAKNAKAADAAPATVQPILETNPAVRSALDSARTEPRDYVRSILLLIDLGRPELAKPIFADLAKLSITDAQRVAIVGEFGSQGMLHLAREKELAPEAAAFADACMAAASATAVDPQRVAALIKQLSDPSPEVRTAARYDLAATGQFGAIATLEALAREADPARRAALISAIELMHPLVDVPLVAMLETGDANLRADVAAILERLAVPQAAPLLAANSATPGLSQRVLASAIVNYKHGVRPFPVDGDNQVELWKWNDDAKKLTSARVPANDAQIAWVARLANELARLQPENPSDQLQALVLRLEANGLTGPRIASPINPAALAQADPQTLSAALALALKSNYSHAALAIVEALGKASDSNTLFTGGGKPSPLADALTSPSRRVRFAALKAIMALNPATPFPGSSRVPDALTWFAGSTGDRQAVVAAPTIAVAGDLAGQLASQRFDAEPTNRGRNAVDAARTMPDLELILIDLNILSPEIRQALYELRTSPTTGDIPIALLAMGGRLEEAKRLAAEHTRVIAVSRPQTPEALAAIAQDLLKLTARDTVPPAERAAEAEQAKKWLDMLAAKEHSFYTIRREPLRSPASLQNPPTDTHPPAITPAPESLPAP